MEEVVKQGGARPGGWIHCLPHFSLARNVPALRGPFLTCPVNGSILSLDAASLWFSVHSVKPCGLLSDPSLEPPIAECSAIYHLNASLLLFVKMT